MATLIAETNQRKTNGNCSFFGKNLRNLGGHTWLELWVQSVIPRTNVCDSYLEREEKKGEKWVSGDTISNEIYGDIRGKQLL